MHSLFFGKKDFFRPVASHEVTGKNFSEHRLFHTAPFIGVRTPGMKPACGGWVNSASDFAC